MLFRLPEAANVIENPSPAEAKELASKMPNAMPCDSCGESLARSGVRGPGLVAPGPRTLVVSDSMPAHRAGLSPLPLADDKVHLRAGRPAQTGP